MMLTTGFRITFGFVIFFFPLPNGLQILFTGFFATFEEVFGKIVGFTFFSVVLVIVCAVLVVGPLVVLAVKVVLLVIMIGLFVVVVVVVAMVGLFVVLQSRAPIFLSSSQSEGEATW